MKQYSIKKNTVKNIYKMACYIPDIFVEDFSKKCFECHPEAENFIDESFI